MTWRHKEISVKNNCFIKQLKKPKDRKAKEREDRDNLILMIAQGILAEGGLQALSMQGIADRTDYSKGTIYQHYGCKEDVVARLVMNNAQSLLGYMDLAQAAGKSIRHKVILVSAAFFMNAKLNTEVVRLVGGVKSADFRKNLSEPYQEELTKIEASMLRRALSLFGQGADLDQQKMFDAAFGWWSMQWGVMDVINNEWDMASLGYADPEQCFFRSLHFYLDGLGIPTDARCHDVAAVKKQTQKIFENENRSNKELP